jgi:hypothetical protein
MARRSSSASLRAGRSTADGTAAFHGALAAQYLARWEGLFAALASPVRHCALLNAFADTHDIDDAFLEPAPLLRAGRVAVHALDVAGSSGCAPPPTCPYTGLRQWYWCDLGMCMCSAPPPVHLITRHIWSITCGLTPCLLTHTRIHRSIYSATFAPGRFPTSACVGHVCCTRREVACAGDAAATGRSSAL